MATHKGATDAGRGDLMTRLAGLRGQLQAKARTLTIRNADEAEELVQETYLTAFEKLEQLRNTNDPAGWLFSILRTTHLDRCRSRAKEALFAEALEDALPDTSGQMRHLEEEGREDLLVLACSNLPRAQATYLRLAVENNWDSEAIAKALEVTEGYTRRLKQMLKKSIQEARRAFLKKYEDLVHAFALQPSPETRSAMAANSDPTWAFYLGVGHGGFYRFCVFMCGFWALEKILVEHVRQPSLSKARFLDIWGAADLLASAAHAEIKRIRGKNALICRAWATHARTFTTLTHPAVGLPQAMLLPLCEGAMRIYSNADVVDLAEGEGVEDDLGEDQSSNDRVHAQAEKTTPDGASQIPATTEKPSRKARRGSPGRSRRRSR